MLINTRDFGEIEIDESNIITFVSPILGFDEYQKYVMLMDEQFGDGLAWLQSLENADVCFILANPKLLDIEYNPEFPAEIMKKIDNQYDEMWLIAVVADEIENTTVNLKSPVLVNTDGNRAVQIVSENDLPIRHKIFSRKEN